MKPIVISDLSEPSFRYSVGNYVEIIDVPVPNVIGMRGDVFQIIFSNANEYVGKRGKVISSSSLSALCFLRLEDGSSYLASEKNLRLA